MQEEQQIVQEEEQILNMRKVNYDVYARDMMVEERVADAEYDMYARDAVEEDVYADRMY